MNTLLVILLVAVLSSVFLALFLGLRSILVPTSQAESNEDRHIPLTLSKGEVDERPYVLLEWMEPLIYHHRQREFTIYRVEKSEVQFFQLATTRYPNYKDFSVQTGKTYSYWVVYRSRISNPDSLPSPIESITI